MLWHWAARIGPQRVVIIGKRDALVRRERRVLATRNLVQLAADSQLWVSVGSRGRFPIAFFRITHPIFFTHD
jgi:hypothetical protein